MSKKFLIVFIIAVAVVLVGAWAVYFSSKSKKAGEGVNIVPPSPSPIPSQSPAGSLDVKDNIGNATENPLENMPATNHLENVSNPFQYKNPFK